MIWKVSTARETLAALASCSHMPGIVYHLLTVWDLCTSNSTPLVPGLLGLGMCDGAVDGMLGSGKGRLWDDGGQMCNGSRPAMCSDAVEPVRASRSSPSLRASLLPKPLQQCLEDTSLHATDCSLGVQQPGTELIAWTQAWNCYLRR